MIGHLGRIASLGLCLVGTGCVASAGTSAAPAGDDSPNLVVARRFFEALGKGDRETIAQLYANNVRVWVSGSLSISGSYSRDQALRGIDGLYDSFPEGLEFVIRGATEQGERLALEVESRAVTRAGIPYHNRYHYLLVIRGGAIHEIREYMDTQHVQEVMLGGANQVR